MNAGIDYGFGKTNIDLETGIRYGVIAVHSVLQAWAESAEADYGKPSCPHCTITLSEIEEFSICPYCNKKGKLELNELTPCCGEILDPDPEGFKWCPDCGERISPEDLYPLEPLGWYLDDGEYQAVDCLDSDIMIVKSPYFTYSRFCSPCVPGAGDLNSPDEDGVKTYCFGHDWFWDEGKAPYPVYRVKDSKRMSPDDPAFKT